MGLKISGQPGCYATVPSGRIVLSGSSGIPMYFAFLSELYSLQVRSGSIAVVVSGGSRELARVKRSLKRLKRSQKVKRVHRGKSVAFTVVALMDQG